MTPDRSCLSGVYSSVKLAPQVGSGPGVFGFNSDRPVSSDVYLQMEAPQHIAPSLTFPQRFSK